MENHKVFNPDEADFDLISKRIVYISGKITLEMSNKFGKVIVWLNAQSTAENITMYIDSGGGNVMAALDMYDMIKHSKAPVIGIVYRGAASMASLILQGCVERCAMPNAELLIHSIRLNELPLSEVDEDLEKAIEKSRRSQNIVNKIYAQRLGCSVEQIKKMNSEDKPVFAEEALALNIIDKII